VVVLKIRMTCNVGAVSRPSTVISPHHRQQQQLITAVSPSSAGLASILFNLTLLLVESGSRLSGGGLA